MPDTPKMAHSVYRLCQSGRPVLPKETHSWCNKNKLNKLTSVFHASALLLIMNFVITLLKYASWIRSQFVIQSTTKSQKGQNEVKTRDKNAKNLNFIKSDATKIKNLSRSLNG